MIHYRATVEFQSEAATVQWLIAYAQGISLFVDEQGSKQ